MSDILDGTSQTFAVGERSSRGPKAPRADANPNLSTSNTCLAALWLGFAIEGATPEVTGSRALIGITIYRMQDGLTTTIPPVPEEVFSSLHPGGANFLMCDGSVRFIRETITWTPVNVQPNGIYNRLSHRKDGQAMGSDF
jgi:prepilin-type processing-associated H-X9-DG protein